MAKVKLVLYNGHETKEAWNDESEHFIDDWKPEERELGPFDAVQLTFGQHLKAHNDEKNEFVDMPLVDGFVEYDGVYFGDFSVVAADE